MPAKFTRGSVIRHRFQRHGGELLVLRAGLGERGDILKVLQESPEQAAHVFDWHYVLVRTESEDEVMRREALVALADLP